MDGHDISNQVNASVHGYSGTVADSLANFASSLDPKVIAAIQELGDEFPYNLDMNDGNELGVDPVFVQEHNIDVVLNALVTRILPDGAFSGGPVLRFRSVEASASSDKEPTIFTATKEIIISAGAVRTPQLLLLSGVGPKSHLDAMGVETLVDNPSVGDRFADHPALQIEFYSNEPFPTDEDRLEWMREWNETRSGRLTISSTNMRGYSRMTEVELTEYERRFGLPDPAPGKKASHYELIFLRNVEATTQSTVVVIICNLNPRSYGQIRLNTTDPYASPLISPNMLNEEADAHVLKVGYKAARRFLNPTVFNDFLLGPLNNETFPDSNDDQDIHEFIRSKAFSLRHPSGSAAMSRDGVEQGVVDPNLKLKGAQGVRVVDASVFVPRSRFHSDPVLF
ncbi:hypothetical protein AAF712_006144 [Marasmius tenuissimus]|uniref:Glucose-methanol-choline oxidoreductase N-terminal domain-containing protein n=1 Tax=Marasmius tenuissimus TaxID=585030 RepID=A0ABR3A156_9AGAR